MIADTTGYTLLTRARDAAVEVIRAICLVRPFRHFCQTVLIRIALIAGDQAYTAVVRACFYAESSSNAYGFYSSLPLFRTQLAIAVTHLVFQTSILPQAPMTSVPLIQSMVRQAYDCLGGETDLRGTLLDQVVASGDMVKKDVINTPADQSLWRKVIGGF